MIFDFFAIMTQADMIPGVGVDTFQLEEGGASERDSFVRRPGESLFSMSLQGADQVHPCKGQPEQESSNLFRALMHSRGTGDEESTHPKMMSGWGMEGFWDKKEMMVWA